MAVTLSRMHSYILLLLGVVLFGIAGIIYAEGLSLFDAWYFVVVTIATVGFGDISPATPLGKIVTVLIIIAGVGTFVAVAADLVETLLTREERRKRRRKINMIIGLFFSEFGTEMIRILSAGDPRLGSIRRELLLSDSWSSPEFSRIRKRLTSQPSCIPAESLDFQGLSAFLSGKKGFLLTLLENPVVFEHDSFTETLQAFFHLTEELMNRRDLARISPADARHLAGDVNRGYRLIIGEWISYMEHLSTHYPYLFSLAWRRNPFNPDASAEVEDDLQQDRDGPGSM